MMNFTRYFQAFFVLFIILVNYNILSSQTYSWEQTNGPYGGNILSLIADSSGHFFAGTADGIFRSTDGGKSWKVVNESLTNIVTFAISSEGHLFAGGSAVLRSTNDGETWEVVTSGLPLSPKSIVINIDGDIFAGGTWNVWRSQDNGETWQLVSNGLTNRLIQALAISPNGYIFAGTNAGTFNGAGLFRSTDNGDTWIQTNAGLPQAYVTSLTANSMGHIFAAPVNFEFTEEYGFGVYRSLDDGETWESVNNSDLSEAIVRSIEIDSAGNIFVCTKSKGIFRSTDNGQSWVQSNSGLSNPQLQSIAFSYNIIIVGTKGTGVYISRDSGNNWQPSNTGFAYLPVMSIAINGETGLIFVGTPESGIFRSSDGGEHWIPVNTGLTSLSVSALGVNADGDVFAGTGGGLFRTIDNGNRWESINTGLNATAFAFNESGHIFVIADHFFYRSEDNGDNWTSGGFGRFGDIAVSSNGSIFAASTGEGIFRSLDNGATWEFAGLNRYYVLSIVINRAGIIFAAAGGRLGAPDGVFRSTNNGGTWILILRIQAKFLALDNEDRIYAGTDILDIQVSDDNGDNWTPLGEIVSKSLNVFSVNSNGHIFAGTYDGVFRAIESVTAIRERTQQMPETYSLYQNHPNPFNPLTTIKFTLPRSGFVTLKVYNLLGHTVETLVSEVLSPGEYEVDWNASGLASGIYLYRLQSEEFDQTKKLTLLK